MVLTMHIWWYHWKWYIASLFIAVLSFSWKVAGCRCWLPFLTRWCFHPCSFVCWLVSERICTKTTGQIFKKLWWRIVSDKNRHHLHFPFKLTDPVHHFDSLYYERESCVFKCLLFMSQDKIGLFGFGWGMHSEDDINVARARASGSWEDGRFLLRGDTVGGCSSAERK